MILTLKLKKEPHIRNSTKIMDAKGQVMREKNRYTSEIERGNTMFE